MNETTWWSQQYAPEGSVAGDGIVKQLGRPSLDPLTILVREAAQNSWDARTDRGDVSFQVHLRRLGPTAHVWRRILLPGPDVSARILVDDVLTEDAVILVVSDRNTVGLGGPLRAGSRPDSDEKPDFVQFLRNVGEPRDHEHGGGTYGFGKGIFYRASRAGAILVDTLAAGADPRRRLMGAALGDSYYIGDQRYTGRHWWGVVEDDVPDPLTGVRASEVALTLGLPGFADGVTGTDIVVIAPRLGSVDATPDSAERTVDEAAQYLASSILWHLWPKYLPDVGGRSMRFAVKVDERDIVMPSPTEVDELQPFVESLSEIRAGGGTSYSRTVPPKNAGAFSLKLSAAARAADAPHNAACPIAGPLHHVARMRTPELIVDYQAGIPHPDARLSYGAVFRASPEADDAFAAAEPPTHDAWIANGLTGSTKGVVQRVQGFIAGQIERSIGAQHAERVGDGAGLGDLSARLAMLIPPPVRGTRASDQGAGSRAGGGSAGGEARGGDSRTRRTPFKPKIIDSPRLQIFGEEPRIVAKVLVPASDTPRTVQAQVNVVVEGGGTEADPPEGARVPRVIEWRATDGSSVEGDVLTLPAGEVSDWWLHTSYVDDAVVRVKVTAESRHGS